jgi:hypothetical protein
MRIGGESGVDPVVIGFVCVLLLVFGVLYNRLIEYLERRHYLEGFVSISVVAGVGVTLLGMFFIDPTTAVVMLLLFICSGAPMIWGSIMRYVKAREAHQKSLREFDRD